MPYVEPTLGQLAAILRNAPQARADNSLARLLDVTDGAVDLAIAEHRYELLRWLNRWGCRLRVPRVGEADVFAASILEWWAAGGATLPSVPVAELDANSIDLLADAYAELERRPGALRPRGGKVVGSRRIAPTAASKIMFVLRPETVPPWDAAIAVATVGGITRDHFARHLTVARQWAQAILVQARNEGIPHIPAHVRRPHSSLAKLRDEWMYLTITRNVPIPSS
jgi:hypothetical protein